MEHMLVEGSDSSMDMDVSSLWRTPRQSLDLIVAPPPHLAIPSQHSPARVEEWEDTIADPGSNPSMGRGPALHQAPRDHHRPSPQRSFGTVAAPSLEVVLHDPRSQKVVLWDSRRQEASLHNTVAHSYRVCPYCHRPMPAPTPEEPRHAHAFYVSPHYFALLGRQGMQQVEEVDNVEVSHHFNQDLSLPALPPSVSQQQHAGSLFLLTDGEREAQAAEEKRHRHGVQQQQQEHKEHTGSAAAGVSHSSPPLMTKNRPASSDEEAAKCAGRELPRENLNDGYYTRFFEEVRRIGSGAFGSVYECKHVMDGVFLGSYAVKIAPVGDNRLWLRKVLREVTALQSLQHRNVVRYMHSWLENHTNSPFAPVVPCLFILMEYANSGNLHTRLGLDLPLARRPLQSEERVWTDLVDMCSGVQYLHGMGIVHRDLKPENILIQQHEGPQVATMGRYRLLISDLGQSRQLSDVKLASSRGGNTGTVRYTAPEMLEERNRDGITEGGGFSMRRQYTHGWSKESDVWSLGCCLMCSCFSQVPYEHMQDLPELADAIVKGPSLPLPMAPPRPAALIELLLAMLAQNPADRPDIDVVMSFPVMREAIRNRFRSCGGAAPGEPMIHTQQEPPSASLPQTRIAKVISEEDMSMHDNDSAGASAHTHVGTAQRHASHTAEGIAGPGHGATLGVSGSRVGEQLGLIRSPTKEFSHSAASMPPLPSPIERPMLTYTEEGHLAMYSSRHNTHTHLLEPPPDPATRSGLLRGGGWLIRVLTTTRWIATLSLRFLIFVGKSSETLLRQMEAAGPMKR